MPEHRLENILREAAPPAPQQLRDRVRALPEPTARRQLRLRPVLAAAVVIAVAVGLGAAAIGGLSGSGPRKDAAVKAEARQLNLAPMQRSRPRTPGGGGSDLSLYADPSLVPSSRLQQYGVSMSIRVRDLSHATQSAVRTTRRLDGYVANADYSTSGSTGNSILELRVPIHRVQQAIASFTNLGTILSQRIAVADLQAGVDRIDRRLAAARKVVSELAERSRLTPGERVRLDAARSTIARLSQSRTRLVREGTYAKISLSLTTSKAAAKHVAPGRFDRFWGDAGDILGKEAVIVLYALVVAGPFAILAAFALLGERWRRRRADGRLLEETA